MTNEASQDREMVDVQILGETYTLRSETSPEYTQRVAEHVDRMAREIEAFRGSYPSRCRVVLE
jgi:cell division protein ZapA (FtsZ GTPase activity inhibitor)